MNVGRGSGIASRVAADRHREDDTMNVRIAIAAAATVAAASTLAAPTAAAPDDPATLAAPDIDVAAVQAHLDALQQIADENGGNRATGTTGYRASVDYVTEQLETAGYTVTEQPFDTFGGESYNITAELAGADPSRVVMLGGHLDSVDAGAGINDNGSGSAGELATALAFAEANPNPSVTVRFAWWGAEEQGLLGSSHYVDSLDAAELDRIDVYLNFDMIGSPNGGYFVYDGDDAVEGTFNEFLATRDIQTAPTTVGGRSDHAAFEDAGVPIGGLFTGAEGTKTEEEAQLWGGTAGEPYDPCYHSECDTTANIDPTMLDNMSDAMSYTVWSLTAPETLDDAA
ncbi:M28 family metallopeptidase [Solicola gregarius]|uniref:M28 family metallopeptidase n=1 Tax=Solicola gregarius TaxID=2908642 RepID=A0AA46TLY0_9ACTN|nr:M28 family metallopeptidase [Solicola gregarius]UYM07490.1 M28 family metallopeptidase [Solicola gregarius]